MEKRSDVMKKIGGCIIIHKNNEDHLCTFDDLQHTKHFSVGQLFNAVREFYGKTVQQYGKRWPQYYDPNTQSSSNAFAALNEVYNNCSSDYEFIVEVCNQLQEEIPHVIERSEVQKNLNQYTSSAQ